MNLFFRQFPNFQSNIINIPLFALLWGWIHVYLYLGPSDIHHVHVMHLDLNNLRHFQVVRKQLWRALNFVLRSWLAMMAEFARGKGWDLNFLWCLSCILSCLTLTGCMICSLSVASINQWATCSDSEDMDVRDGFLFGLGSRIYDLSWLHLTEYGTYTLSIYERH